MGIAEQLAKFDIVNFAAALALLLYAYLVYQHVVLAVMSTDPMAAYKDVLLWALPVLLNILATYGIIKGKE